MDIKVPIYILSRLTYKCVIFACGYYLVISHPFRIEFISLIKHEFLL